MAALMRYSRPFRQVSCSFCSQLSDIGSHSSQRYNSNRASISRIKKTHYVRMYPTAVILPDGSSINIRYEKPRRILKLPVDVSTLTEKEKERRKMLLTPQRQTKPKEKKDTKKAKTFDISSYADMIKKKK